MCRIDSNPFLDLDYPTFTLTYASKTTDEPSVVDMVGGHAQLEYLVSKTAKVHAITYSQKRAHLLAPMSRTSV